MTTSLNQVLKPHPVDENLLLYNLKDELYSRMKVFGVGRRYQKKYGPTEIAKLWKIGLDSAKLTYHSTLQDNIREVSEQTNRRIKTLPHHRQYKQLSGYLSHFATDTFESNVRSLSGKKYVQLFANKGNYSRAYPIASKSEAPEALALFIHEVGIPTEILSDGASELTKGNFAKRCQMHNIRQRTTKPHSPWQNHSELVGGIIKRKVRHLLRTTRTPVRLWDHCWMYVSDLRSLTATSHPILDGRTPYKKVHGYTPNVAEYLQFKWYDWVRYHDPPNPDKYALGKWLGPSHTIGQSFASKVLTKQGKVIVRSTIFVPEETESLETEKEEYTRTVESTIGNNARATIVNSNHTNEDPYSSLFVQTEGEHDDQVEDSSQYNKYTLDSDPPYVESEDNLIGSRVSLPHLGEMQEVVVKRRKRNEDGTLVGTANNNPLLDTRIYEVELQDGSYEEYSTNVLLENLHAQTDDNGWCRGIFDEIIDHKMEDNALGLEDGWIETHSGVKKRVITTKGWSILVKWKDGTFSWVPLSVVKESNPIELAEYATVHDIQKFPAFAWWTKYVLKKRDKIISKVKSDMVKDRLKFGIKVPQTIQEALQIDKDSNTNFWRKAIEKEHKNVLVAFQLLEDDELLPIGSKRIPYHMIFDVKFDLTRKARLVAGGHRAPHVPAHTTYSTVASRESVRILFLLAALNEVSIQTADIGNAYLNAPCREKVHVIVGPELFGPANEGKRAIIVHALYGLKSASAAWRKHLVDTIRLELGYKSSKGDSDVFMKRYVTTSGVNLYAYILIYVDDILCVHEDPGKEINKLGTYYRLKEGSVKEPDIFLGANFKQWEVSESNGSVTKAYAMSCKDYVKEAIKVVEKRMNENGFKYTSSRRHGRKTPFSSSDYRPEMDKSPLCTEKMTTLYQNCVGILRWMCKLGRLDILHKTSLLSQYLTSPREGHLHQAFNIFNYLKHCDKNWIVFDPGRFEISWTPMKEEPHPHERSVAMQEMYPDAKLIDPPDIPQLLGKPIQLTTFVDADHAGNKVTQRSHTGILILANMAPIFWFSKKQNTIESSTFGSEFIALKQATEIIEGLIYKLLMLGIPVI